MKVLLAIDGSTHSDVAVTAVANRQWPAGTEVEILTVIHSSLPVIPVPAFTMAAAHVEQTREQRADAPQLLNAAADRVRAHASTASVATKVLEGPPREVIVQEAREWGADLIVLGSHGRGPRTQALLGSVASGVAADAPCTVEVITEARPDESVDASPQDG